jgi:predicted nucleotidyltransferase
MISIIQKHRTGIESLCRSHRVKRLELFGSATRGDFDSGTSDLDFFVEFEPLGWEGSSDRYFGLLHGLEDLLQRHIDLVDLAAVKNPYFIEVATMNRELLYAT